MNGRPFAAELHVTPTWERWGGYASANEVNEMFRGYGGERSAHERMFHVKHLMLDAMGMLDTQGAVTITSALRPLKDAAAATPLLRV